MSKNGSYSLLALINRLLETLFIANIVLTAEHEQNKHLLLCAYLFAFTDRKYRFFVCSFYFLKGNQKRNAENINCLIKMQ